MAEARAWQLWDHTSELMAVIANGLLRGERDPPFLAAKLHPLKAAKIAKANAQVEAEWRAEQNRMGFGMLKEAYGRG